MNNMTKRIGIVSFNLSEPWEDPNKNQPNSDAKLTRFHLNTIIIQVTPTRNSTSSALQHKLNLPLRAVSAVSSHQWKRVSADPKRTAAYLGSKERNAGSFVWFNLTKIALKKCGSQQRIRAPLFEGSLHHPASFTFHCGTHSEDNMCSFISLWSLLLENTTIKYGF